MLRTWSKIENPPKPSKKAQSIILWDINLLFTFAANLTPFVNSIIPVIKPFANLGSILIHLKMVSTKLHKTLKMWLFFKIERITEKSTIKPPISKVVEIAELMLFPRISPRFEKEQLRLLEILFFLSDIYLKKYSF